MDRRVQNENKQFATLFTEYSTFENVCVCVCVDQQQDPLSHNTTISPVFVSLNSVKSTRRFVH